ncbi:BAG family molecular chaperone regulator 2-like [Coffea arabica]|uniref:BAG family molecular chaperone regulator 2-like n=1 Tax=Coffea arabica TaxID=13443 RepID=A0ABM4VP61_COFAR
MIKRKFNRARKSSGDNAGTTTTSSDVKEEEVEWEMRPGGMLVQKRSENCSDFAAMVPRFRVRVVFGAMRYEISISSQATFGELKKLLTADSGLQPGEQRLIYRGKERQNGDYLDRCGVKDHSKVILMESPEFRERKFIEMRRNAKIQAAHRLIDDVLMEVDKLAEQVCAIEKSITHGNKVPELQITTLIEMLMRQAVKLDIISAEGDACEKKSLQGKRVEKCVETLDVLKLSNARIKPVIVTTNWETFDPPQAIAKWELFD